MSIAVGDIPRTNDPGAPLPKVPAGPTPPPPFGVNELRLTPRQWLATLIIVLACYVLVPWTWKRAETFAPGADYRIPYALSKDYWLYEQRPERHVRPDQIPLLGDSVVWGEYVRPDGTLSHYLNQHAGTPDRFLNYGVNGMFPLALEGLVEDYGRSIRNRKVIVQCNVLWMSSPKADLSSSGEENFNHARLVPQFTVHIPCYRADANERLSATIERHVEFFAWAGHLENAYFSQHGIPQWTLEEDGSNEPNYPNAWRSPLTAIRAGLPGEPAVDPQRGPSSPRHKPWNAGGGEPVHFDWVDLDASLQWQAFQRLVRLLRGRGDDVLVILGPFNEHMIAEDQRSTFRSMRDRIQAWLTGAGVGVVVPDTLPTDLYADASHPLTAGYDLLARRILDDSAFTRWLNGSH